MKHLPYRSFERFFVPWLARNGYERDSYEVVCVVREPISWLHSWWRYRTRNELSNPRHQKHAKYAGGTSFEQFATEYVRGVPGIARVGRQANFVRGDESEIGVDRMFRFEQLDRAVQFLEERAGFKITLERRNVSPSRPLELSTDVESELRVFLEPEYRLWDMATGERLTPLVTDSRSER